jgi:ATP-dependent DNA helicase PIF1
MENSAEFVCLEGRGSTPSCPPPTPSSPCRSPSKAQQQPQLQLSEEQEDVMKGILDSSVMCVYVDGSAGTGKSHIIAEAVRRLEKTTALKRVHVVAPTGIAAENVEGRTIHSFFGISDYYSDCSKRYWSRDLESAQCIIVDEISMVSAETFDLMDKIARMAKMRGNGSGNGDIIRQPFGGVKIICVGDLYQLLPVNKESRERCPNEVRSRGLVFNSSVWKSLEHSMRKFSLKTSMRHQADPYFMESLNKIRNATMTQHEFEKFQACLQQKKLKTVVAAGGNERKNDGDDSDCHSNSFKVVHLFPTATEVNEMNTLELRKLTGSEYRFCNFRWQLQGMLTDCRFWYSEPAAILKVKVGAQVMLTKNLNVTKPFLVNGSRGVVSEFYTTRETRDWIEQKLISLDAQSTGYSILKDRLRMQLKLCEALLNETTYIDEKIEFKRWPVVDFQNGVVMPILPLKEKEISKKGGPSVLEMVFPLQLAWAITIHKSQGLTIDRVYVDLHRKTSCRALRAKPRRCPAAVIKVIF